MEKFFINVIAGVFADARVQAAIKKLLSELVDEKVLPLLPLAAATAATALGEQLQVRFDKVLEADPDIPGISDVFDLSETIRNTLNGHPEVNIPLIGDFLKGLGGK